MSNGKFLLDTNIVIGLFAGDSAVLNHLQRVEQAFLPAIVIGELCYGAQRSSRSRANLGRVRELAETLPVLNCDIAVAFAYGEIKNALKQRGRSVPENDVWIAAIAHQHKLTLATRDAHFRELPEISTAIW